MADDRHLSWSRFKNEWTCRENAGRCNSIVRIGETVILTPLGVVPPEAANSAAAATITTPTDAATEALAHWRACMSRPRSLVNQGEKA